MEAELKEELYRQLETTIFDESKVVGTVDVISMQNDGKLILEYREQEFLQIMGN